MAILADDFWTADKEGGKINLLPQSVSFWILWALALIKVEAMENRNQSKV